MRSVLGACEVLVTACRRDERDPRCARTCPPRLMRCELGNTSFSSFANCTRRLLGSREVVMRAFGSRSAACAYSSSMCVRGT